MQQVLEDLADGTFFRYMLLNQAASPTGHQEQPATRNATPPQTTEAISRIAQGNFDRHKSARRPSEDPIFYESKSTVEGVATYFNWSLPCGKITDYCNRKAKCIRPLCCSASFQTAAFHVLLRISGHYSSMTLPEN